jgi:hypothetical protein
MGECTVPAGRLHGCVHGASLRRHRVLQPRLADRRAAGRQAWLALGGGAAGLAQADHHGVWASYLLRFPVSGKRRGACFALRRWCLSPWKFAVMRSDLEAPSHLRLAAYGKLPMPAANPAPFNGMSDVLRSADAGHSQGHAPPALPQAPHHPQGP